ncbi:MAG: response regulator [Acidobacteriia bacterium]|nr:response regulator [Terriglobia bacterium]
MRYRRRMDARLCLDARRGFVSMKNILIVDDESCVRELCVEFLSMAGYEVDASASGEEALKALAQRSYDLLILDLRMKGMNGLTTFNRAKTLAPETRAVVVSGSVDEFESELLDARRDGLWGILPKPFDLQDLSALVESACHGQIQTA